MKRKPGRPKKQPNKTVSADSVVGGRRGRRSMPAVRNARRLFAQAQRRVASQEKAIRQDQLAVVMAADRQSAAQARGRLKAAAKLLVQARKTVRQCGTELKKVLKEEAAKSRQLAQARLLALYKEKLQARSGRDLEKALARFASAWKKKRNKTISKKLAVRLKKEAAKSRAAARKANAKARDSVRQAEALAKARARKAAVKARARIRKLMAKAKTAPRLAVVSARRKSGTTSRNRRQGRS